MHKLKCLYTNAQSIVKKLPELRLYITEEDPDIVAITESWTSDNNPDSEISIDGYTLFRKDRKHINKTRGGGCLMYIKESINAVINEQMTNSENVESVWCDIKTDNSSVLVGVCYRSPNNTVDENTALYNLLKQSSQAHCVIMGDFNQPEIKWDMCEATGSGAELLDVIQDVFLTQHVMLPTHKHGNILDLILTSEPNMVEEISIREPLSTSDHNMIMFDVTVSITMKRRKQVTYDYKKGDYEAMRQFLSQIDWKHELQNKNTEEMWTVFKEKMDEGVTSFIPTRTNYSKKKQKWMTKTAMKAIKNKYHLWKKFSESSNYQDYVEYKKALNKATNEIRKAKRNFEVKLAENIKSDNKSFHAYTRSKLKTKDKVGPLKDDNGNTITDDKECAEKLNSFFTSVFTKEFVDKLPEPRQTYMGALDDSLKNIVITPVIVMKKLDHLKPEKAPGVDNMFPRVIREVSQQIAVPLCEIFQSSLKFSQVPEDWRKANVAALYKKGMRSSASNYRPVSLTSQLCKVLESIIRDSIVEHLSIHNLIKDSQHGFMEGKSCLTNLLIFLNKVTEFVDKGYPVDIIYLDFAKAFDKVPHIRLIKKLEAHGITDTVSKWIAAWLRNRKQRVQINGCSSEWADVTSGVPQGSVLGPVLFTIYINDIDDGVQCNILKFADDTKLFGSCASQQDVMKIQNDLHTMFQWSQDWQMLFNVDKCKSMHIGKNNDHHVYTMNNTALTTTEEEKYLGVTIKNSLSSSQHTSNAVKKANRVLGIISRVFTCKSKEIMLPIYKSMVRPILEYGVQAWCPFLKKDIILLEKVQRRFTRMIPEIRHLSYNQRLKKLNLTTLEMRRFRGDLIESFKIIKDIEKIDKNLLFTFSKIDQTRGHNYKLFKTPARLNIRKFSFTHRIVDAWNKLPYKAVNCKTVDQFKRYLKYNQLRYLMGDHTSEEDSLPRQPLM